MTDSATTAAPPRVFRSDVRAARRRLAGQLRKTPVFHTTVAGFPVSLKLEYLQHGGTFQLRGSLNALLTAAARPTQVVLAAGGNAGIAAALAAAGLGRTCTVVVPETAPHSKVAAMWSHGAEVRWHGTTLAEACAHAVELAAGRGALYLPVHDTPAVVAGIGVLGLELEEQVRGRPPVLAAVGDGALIGGLAAALGRRQQVIGVEPERRALLRAALSAERPVGVPAADSAGPDRIGAIALDLARRTEVPALTVTDDAVDAARDLLWREFRIAVEPSAAAALAALLSGAFVPEPGRRTIVVLCSANGDPAAR
ncbi:pyridoxal-phosphate dependent enzyme [Nocardia asteroides]|uniref:pyridoxal-phosphate dependent enzyme n=1 Tax=Nocardia asteroides TaxID=1824 RepID=UPI001E5338B3|nr:pyridoxal-phosphate dependent enzyme [Nocardia asteroides]UGT60407.1 pyridoxal-phosphate dependent enzyme [Nocardia asteroides]